MFALLLKLNVICEQRWIQFESGLWSRSRGVGVGRIFNLRSRNRRKC